MRRSRHANSPRTVADLTAGTVDGLWTFRGITADGNRYVIVLPTGQRRELTVEQADTYLAWRGIAATEKLEDSLPDRSTILEFLLAPSALDRARLAVWLGVESSGRTVTDVAAVAGCTRKTLAADLHLGRPPAKRRDQRASVEGVLTAAAAELRLPAPTFTGPRRRRPTVDRMQGRVEPVALARLRAVALCEEARLLELTAPRDVHHAFRARELLLTRGRESRLVRADCVVAACAAVADVLDQAAAAKIV